MVGGPALGFDLARLAGGHQVAAVLRTALACGPEQLEALAARHPGGGRRTEWRRSWLPAADTAALVDDLPLAGAALHQAAAGETALLRRLETSLLGDVHAVDRLIRSDILDWTWVRDGAVAVQDPVAAAAADVLFDAAVSAYLRDGLDPALRRALAGPYLRAVGPHRSAPPVPTGMARVDERTQVLGASDEAARAAWRRAVEELRVHTAQWAPAMHQATWALSLTDRLRDALDAQLAGVVAFRDAGFTARDAAYGVWNAWSGVVQAGVVDDLLPAADADVLLRPWRAVHGS